MPKKFVSYLEQLRFQPSLWNSIQAKYITNIRLVVLFVVSIVILGTYSYINIPRRLNPEIHIPIVIVSTILSGAGPQDVETLLTNPLEDKVKSVKGINTMISTSSENSSAIVMQFLSTVDGEKAKSDVKSLVDTVTGLPADAKTPSVQLLDFEDQPFWEFTITTNKDVASLMRFSKQLSDRIKDVSKVDRVVTSGFNTEEIHVVVDPVKINTYGISPLQLSGLISSATKAYPSGNLDTKSSTFSLTIDQDVISIADLRNLRITSRGNSFALSDVAQISTTSKVNQPVTYFQKGNNPPQKTVQFFVYKASGVNIDAAEKDTKEVVNKTIAETHGEFKVTTILNTAEQITKQFNDLLGDFLSTIILVFILLLLFLGLRQAIISSLTVPLTFLSAFTIINALGLSLNFLTMFALLIALGLLIDDTIVTVAAMTRYYATGKFTPGETGVLVWRDFIVPLWSTTITTIWAFVPLLIATGIIGEFIKSIPIVVTATMLSSTTIAVLITLPLMIVFLKPSFPHRVKVMGKVVGILAFLGVSIFLLPKGTFFIPILVAFFALLFVLYQTRGYLLMQYQKFAKGNKYVKGTLEKRKYLDRGIIHIESLSNTYMTVIDKILSSKSARRNTLIAITVFALIGYALVPLGLVKSEFFPKTDEDLVYVNVDMPAGTNLETTKSSMLELLNRLQNTPNTEFIVAQSGAQLSLDSGAGQSSANSSYLITLHLLPKGTRTKTSQEMAEEIRTAYQNYSAGTLTVQEISGGPPAGSDIQIKLLGDDLGVLDSYADKIQMFLKKQPGVTNVSKSVKAGTSKLVFVPDKNKLAASGITIDTLGLWLRTYASGFTLDTIKVGNEDTDISFRLSSTTGTPESLGSLMIPTQSGSSIQLLSLGTMRLENNPTSITHEGGKRTISVSAGVGKGVTATEKNADVEKFANTLHLPEGYSWKTGGVNEENQKSVNSILQAMIISFILILITMVIEFGSYRQSLIAILIIPLAVSGVFYIFALTGTPLSFPALIGILALFGIVVTHAIVVIEKINDNRKHNMTLHNSIVDAAGGRLEPVLLTSLATIVGLIPITLADPLWRGLGGSIIAGLLFSGAIKLFFVPVMYYNWFSGEEEARLAKSKGHRA